MEKYPDKKGNDPKVEELDISAMYTAKNYLNCKLNELVDLIQGKVFKMGAVPGNNHRDFSMKLRVKFGPFFEGPFCEVFAGPIDFLYKYSTTKDFMI